jgi:hypothetical protein
MGKLENCGICRAPVLELDGQFELLQPYYVASGDPAPEVLGEVHTHCLATSPHGAAWARWRLRHFTGVRGYEIAGIAEDWTILQDRRRRSLVALRGDGASIAVDRTDAPATSCAGGGCLSLASDYHLSIDDPQFIAVIQHELTSQRRVPLATIVDHLGIRDKLQWPAVLDAGEYVFSRPLRRDWTSTSVSARMHHELFLPQVVLGAWRAL